jgi:hypothetical protein
MKLVMVWHESFHFVPIDIRQYHQSRQLRHHLVNSNFTFTKLKKLIFANKVNYKSFNYVGTIKRVAVYIFHFQFCNNRLFQGDDVTALTDDITYICFPKMFSTSTAAFANSSLFGF